MYFISTVNDFTYPALLNSLQHLKRTACAFVCTCGCDSLTGGGAHGAALPPLLAALH